MPSYVPLDDAAAKLDQVVADADRGDVVLTQAGEPVAVVMSAKRYDALMEDLEDIRAVLTSLSAQSGDEKVTLD